MSSIKAEKDRYPLLIQGLRSFDESKLLPISLDWRIIHMQHKRAGSNPGHSHIATIHISL